MADEATMSTTRTYSHVRHGKNYGTLTLTSKFLLFEPDSGGGAGGKKTPASAAGSLKMSYTKIAKHQKSPVTKPQAALRVVTVDSRSDNIFEIDSREQLVQLDKDLTAFRRRHAGAGAAATEEAITATLKAALKMPLEEGAGPILNVPGECKSTRDNPSDMLQFLQANEKCFSCSVTAFAEWLQSVDIANLEELAEALTDDEFVSLEMKGNGLKYFKRFTLRKAAAACLDAAAKTKASDVVSPLPQRSPTEPPVELVCPILAPDNGGNDIDSKKAKAKAKATAKQPQVPPKDLEEAAPELQEESPPQQSQYPFYVTLVRLYLWEISYAGGCFILAVAGAIASGSFRRSCSVMFVQLQNLETGEPIEGTQRGYGFESREVEPGEPPDYQNCVAYSQEENDFVFNDGPFLSGDRTSQRAVVYGALLSVLVVFLSIGVHFGSPMLAWQKRALHWLLVLFCFLAILNQGLAFQVFGTNFCQSHICKAGPGVGSAIYALIVWVLLWFALMLRALRIV